MKQHGSRLRSLSGRLGTPLSRQERGRCGLAGLCRGRVWVPGSGRTALLGRGRWHRGSRTSWKNVLASAVLRLLICTSRTTKREMISFISLSYCTRSSGNQCELARVFLLLTESNTIFFRRAYRIRAELLDPEWPVSCRFWVTWALATADHIMQRGKIHTKNATRQDDCISCEVDRLKY